MCLLSQLLLRLNPALHPFNMSIPLQLYFYRAALNAGRSSEEKAAPVCLSVCPSDCRSNACIVTKWKNNLSK